MQPDDIKSAWQQRYDTCLRMPVYACVWLDQSLRICCARLLDTLPAGRRKGCRKGLVKKSKARHQPQLDAMSVCKDIEYQTFLQEEARAGHDIRASASAGADAPDWRRLCAGAAAAAAAQGEAGGGADAAAGQAPAIRTRGVPRCCAEKGCLPSTPLLSDLRVPPEVKLVGPLHAAACQATAIRAGSVHRCCAEKGCLPSTPLLSDLRVPPEVKLVGALMPRPAKPLPSELAVCIAALLRQAAFPAQPCSHFFRLVSPRMLWSAHT